MIGWWWSLQNVCVWILSINLMERIKQCDWDQDYTEIRSAIVTLLMKSKTHLYLIRTATTVRALNMELFYFFCVLQPIEAPSSPPFYLFIYFLNNPIILMAVSMSKAQQNYYFTKPGSGQRLQEFSSTMVWLLLRQTISSPGTYWANFPHP